jgi:glyoxylase I family protein
LKARWWHRASCPFGAGSSDASKAGLSRVLNAVVSGLSDYGRCAFGSGCMVATTSSTTAAIIQVPDSGLVYDALSRSAREIAMSVPFRFRQLDHVVLRVRDSAAMQRFYCDVLGCVEEKQQHEIGLMQLRAGASLIDLVDVTGKLGRQGGAPPGSEGRNVDHFCLSVEGYDEAAIVTHLKAHGARVGDIGMRYGAEGEGPSIYLLDPEDNVVELKGPALPGSRIGAS